MCPGGKGVDKSLRTGSKLSDLSGREARRRHVKSLWTGSALSVKSLWTGSALSASEISLDGKRGSSTDRKRGISPGGQLVVSVSHVKLIDRVEGVPRQLRVPRGKEARRQIFPDGNRVVSVSHVTSINRVEGVPRQPWVQRGARLPPLTAPRV